MNEIILYFLKASFGIIVFYLVFFFTLRKDTTFRVNRIYLIASLLLSLILPIITINIITHISTSNSKYIFTEIDKNFRTLIDNNNLSINSSENISWHDILIIAYITGASIFSLRLLWQSFVLVKIISNTTFKRINGLKIIENNKFGLPFSFFNIVFINPKFHFGPDLTNILAHEKVHIREHHWFDLFIIELLTVIFWFNPFVWLYERSIKQNHEYLADEGVLAQGLSIGQYQAILINQIMGMQIIGLTNNLNYSLNKKRMKMMTKMKTSKNRAFKVIWALPAIAILLVAFAKPAYEIAPARNIEISKSNNQEVRNIKLQGKVIDEKGLPLEGASIIIGGTSIGTTTNKDGLFTISSAKTDKLYISYIGYATIVEDLSSLKQNTNEIYSQIFTMKIGVINLEIDQMLKEKPLSNLKEEGSSNTNKKSGEEEVFVIVEKLPDYPGGDLALAQEITKKVQKSIQLNQTKGKVVVGFSVLADGSIANVQALEKDNEKAAKEAITIISGLKAWKLGIQRGKAVPVNYSMKINF